MKTGILFDLDGTLLDTLEDLLDATNYALTLCGYPPRTLGELRMFVGNGARNQIRMSLPSEASSEEIDRVLGVYKPYYTSHCQLKTHPYAGIPEALKALDFPIAIVSNKPDAAVKSLCEDYFPGIFAMGETPPRPRKPAPDMLHRAMDAIHVDSCIYVGDSEVDILTAQNAQVPCVSVLWGFRDRGILEQAGAQHLCSSPALLPQMLKEIAGIERYKEDFPWPMNFTP